MDEPMPACPTCGGTNVREQMYSHFCVDCQRGWGTRREDPRFVILRAQVEAWYELEAEAHAEAAARAQAALTDTT